MLGLSSKLKLPKPIALQSVFSPTNALVAPMRRSLRLYHRPTSMIFQNFHSHIGTNTVENELVDDYGTSDTVLGEELVEGGRTMKRKLDR